MIFEAEYRRFSQLIRGKAAIAARLTHFESLPIDQVAPQQFEGTRAGLRFALGNSGVIVGIAPVQTLPTTSAQWLLWNNNSSASGIGIAFEELGVYLTSGTPGAGGALLAALVSAPAQIGATYAGTAIASASGSTKGSGLIVKTSVTITQPAVPVWYPVAQNPSSNAGAFPGMTFLENRNLQGGLIIPPQSGLALAVLAPLGTLPLFAPFAKWFEAASDFE